MIDKKVFYVVEVSFKNRTLIRLIIKADFLSSPFLSIFSLLFSARFLKKVRNTTHSIKLKSGKSVTCSTHSMEKTKMALVEYVSIFYVFK